MGYVLVALFVGKEATIVLIAGMAWLCCSEFFHICRMGGSYAKRASWPYLLACFSYTAYFGHVFPLVFSFAFDYSFADFWYVFKYRSRRGGYGLWTLYNVATFNGKFKVHEPSFSIPLDYACCHALCGLTIHLRICLDPNLVL